MKMINLRSCTMASLFVLGMQSLADIAREEAERRRLLEQQGIEGKVIEGNPTAVSSNGNLTTSTLSSSAPKRKSTQTASSKSQRSLRSFRDALRKLDRAIRQEEKSLKTRQTRLQAERWALPKAGKVSGSNRSEDVQERLRAEIEETQSKLEELRRERKEIYDEGKKAGFLPGELEGKGLIP